MCERYRIRADDLHESTIKRIVDRRNALFHEALWEGAQPSGGGSSLGFYDVFALHRLNQRLICAVLGYQNLFVCSPWHTLGPAHFDKMG